MPARKLAPKGKGKPTEYERLVISKGNEKKRRTIDRGVGVEENEDHTSATAAAARDLRAMEAREGDPFAAKPRRGDWTPYVATKRDIKKGVVEDPKVFKGDDAPLPRATSRQLSEAAAAQRRLDVVKKTRDGGGRITRNTTKQEEKDRGTIGVISQYSGGSGLESQRCATPGCNNNTTEITCTDCTAKGDPAGKTYRDAPSERAVQRTAVKTSRNAELQEGIRQGAA